MGEIKQHRTLIRVILGYLALQIGIVAVGILIGPKSFYENFPVGASSWVSALPPYNEHLIRDFGAAGLGLAAVAALAVVWMERRLVQAACVGIFLGTLPHAIYHSTTTESYSTVDNIFSLGGLYFQTLLPLALLYLASGARQDPTGAPSGPKWRPQAQRQGNPHQEEA